MQAEPGVTAAFEIGPSERRYQDLFCYAEPQALELCMTGLELSQIYDGSAHRPARAGRIRLRRFRVAFLSR